MQDLLKYDGRKSEDSDCASLFIGILTCGDCRTPMIRKKKGLLLEGYHAGYCTREGYLEGGRELEQRISGLEQRRARIRDDMAECEKLPESERKGQEFLLKYAGFAELTKEMADAFVDRIEIGQDKAVDIFWRFHGGKVDGQRGCLSEI